MLSLPLCTTVMVSCTWGGPTAGWQIKRAVGATRLINTHVAKAPFAKR
jgi:hypothetical protein